MFIVKGVLLGAVMFFVFSSLYFYAWFGPFSNDKAIGFMAIQAVIVKNYLYWTAGVLMLVLGCVIMAIWPHKVSP